MHIFFNYAGTCSVVHTHINKSVLNGFMVTELLAVTAYIIYDNLCTPPYVSRSIAIAGYLFVYGLILVTWAMYRVYTVLDEDKVYEMTINSRVRFRHKDYFRGTVIENKHKIEVFLSYSPAIIPSDEMGKKRKVKFSAVFRGQHILVKLA